MASDKQLVAVVGATGGQGGSVVDALLETGRYQLRAIVRDPSSENAQQLAARGVEVVRGNLDDKASLVEAFKGAYAIFGVTNFFETFMKYGPAEAEKRELVQAKNLAEAAAATSGLHHYIWSTLPSSAALSQGKYHNPHFESKATVDEYILKDLPDLAAKTTFLWVTYYASNLTFPLCTPSLLQTSGQYAWVQPAVGETPITTIGDHRKNVGIFVEAIFRQPQLTRGGKYVLAEVETLTNQALLERWSKVTGKSTVYVPSTVEAYNKLFPDWGLEMGAMLKFWEELREASWKKPGVTPLRKEDLGIDVSRLTGLEAAIAQINWG
ncbi:NmrA/HSCARG family protein [Aspergillus clavatus NRRL 1]|uniref:NmrA-like domain-containing protein n=1 Tax=Aspergillus clavatus (strain ATCC 1007 / CBS 513.65 / DSM 816 / NCTC 3887 / NRRL 1 / QM 1276 / 107) TaxID=344612 RepID=A1CCG6_ASPCL|nr:uncharacterized protein ACLA_061850 [Aspergillus clavatus NRRL 1]EAW12223.1 conserved hypothetical protein [Aspergillus clavatus NRRL 1]